MQYILFAVLTGLYTLCLYAAPLSVGTILLSAPLCAWLSNVLHELGHLAAYGCMGLPWLRLRISCFVVRREKGKLHFCFEKQNRLYTAECACKYDARLSPWRYRVALLSGGLSCAIACPLLVACSLPLQNSADSFLLSLGLAMGLNAVGTLLHPRSADRLLLKNFLEERR